MSRIAILDLERTHRSSTRLQKGELLKDLRESSQVFTLGYFDFEIPGLKFYNLSFRLFNSYHSSGILLMKILYHLEVRLWGLRRLSAFERYITSKRVCNFCINNNVDKVVSVSHPILSHEIFPPELSARIYWLQLWFEPYYSNSRLHDMNLRDLKHAMNIMSLCDKVLVSNASLKRIYSSAGVSIDCVDLKGRLIEKQEIIYDCVYVGSYFSEVRDILPLYSVLQSGNLKSLIIGPSDIDLCSRNGLIVDDLEVDEASAEFVEGSSRICVVLLNCRGLAWPGKLYSYARSNLRTLVILDGDNTVSKEIQEHFRNCSNFHFVRNQVDSIREGLETLNSKALITAKYDYKSVKVYL